MDELLTKIDDALAALPLLDAQGKRLITDALVSHLPALVAEVRRLRDTTRLRVRAAVAGALAGHTGRQDIGNVIADAILESP